MLFFHNSKAIKKLISFVGTFVRDKHDYPRVMGEEMEAQKD